MSFVEPIDCHFSLFFPPLPSSGLCPDTYPDEVCRGNYSDHSYSPPLLYDLYSDPGEIYTLNNEQYSDVMTQIEKVMINYSEHRHNIMAL